MSRLNNLFESAATPGQTYERQPLVAVTYERDPSLLRVLSQPEYFEGLPQRVSAIAGLMHSAAHSARRDSPMSPEIWDFAVTGLNGLMTQLTQKLALAGHTADHEVPTALSLTAQRSLLQQWKGMFNGSEGRQALIQLLTQWCTTVKLLGDDPASDAAAPAYTDYAEQLEAFTQHLTRALQNGPDAELVVPTLFNAVAVDPYEGLDESMEPRNFEHALNHKTPQEAMDNAVTWLMQNRSGAAWTGELLNLLSGLDDIAAYLQGRDSIFRGGLSSKVARKLSAGLEDVASTAQSALLSGLTKALEESGLWNTAPEAAHTAQTPRSVERLISNYDYQVLRGNMVYALATEGGQALHRSYSLLAEALSTAAHKLEKKALLPELTAEQRADYVDALLITASTLDKELNKLRILFSNYDLFASPLPQVAA